MQELCSLTGGWDSVEKVQSGFGVKWIETAEEDQELEAVEAIRWGE